MSTNNKKANRFRLEKMKYAGDFRAESIPVIVQQARLDKLDFPVHEHDFTELVIITGGSGIHVAQDERYHISSGDVFVLSGKQTHGFEDTKNLKLINVMMKAEAVLPQQNYLAKIPGYHVLFNLEPKYRRAHQFSSKLHLNSKDLNRAESISNKTQTLLEQTGIGYEAQVQSLVIELVVFLSLCYDRISSEHTLPLLRLGEVLSFIEEYFLNEITLEALAEKAHLSVNQFLRVFRNATGSSPMEYIIQRRIRHGAELLRKTTASITDCAFACGFHDGNYFSRQFKRVMGISPREYRRQWKT